MTSTFTPAGSSLRRAASSGFDRVHHLTVLVPVWRRTRDHDRRLAPVEREAALFRRAVLGVADVADANGGAADVLDDDVVELRDLLHAAQGAHADFGGPPNDAAAGRFDVLGFQRALHILRRQVVAGQLVQVEEDIDLPHGVRR